MFRRLQITRAKRRSIFNNPYSRLSWCNSLWRGERVQRVKFYFASRKVRSSRIPLSAAPGWNCTRIGFLIMFCAAIAARGENNLPAKSPLSNVLSIALDRSAIFVDMVRSLLVSWPVFQFFLFRATKICSILNTAAQASANMQANSLVSSENALLPGESILRKPYGASSTLNLVMMPLR